MIQNTKHTQSLLQMATQSRLFAHSPYSKFLVGAAVLMADEKAYGGCNVENASYGGTVCGERVAIFKAISESKARLIKEIVVVTDSEKAWPPCGFCRQVIAEFSDTETLIHTANLTGIQATYKLKDLLPEAFTSSFLNSPS